MTCTTVKPKGTLDAMTAMSTAMSAGSVEANGPEDGDQDLDPDWYDIDWDRVEDDVRRLRHRIFTEGLLEPGASKRRTPGSEGAAAQQCAAATRLADLVLSAGGGGAGGAAGQRP